MSELISRAVALPDIGVPLYIGVPQGVTYQSVSSREFVCTKFGPLGSVQGYLAHEKTHPPRILQ